MLTSYILCLPCALPRFNSPSPWLHICPRYVILPLSIISEHIILHRPLCRIAKVKDIIRKVDETNTGSLNYGEFVLFLTNMVFGT